MFKKLLSLFNKKQPWEKQLNESFERFNNRPIYKVLNIDIIANTNDDEIEQLIFDNISQVIGDMQGTEFETVSKLSPAQQALYSTWLVEVEVNNGGFNQFYFNSSGEFAKMAVGGFNQFGLTKYAELVQKANQLFTSIKPDLEKYNDGSMEGFMESYDENPLNELDKEFYNLQAEESVGKARIGYIRFHPEEFMNKNIDFQKIDLPFRPAPNTAVPLVEVHNTDVLLGFDSCELRDYDFYNTKIRQINFVDCLMYREGDPNDEGFYMFGYDPKINNDSIYSKKAFPDLDFNTFYKVTGVDWKNNLLGNGTKVLNGQYKEKENFNHFVFFMKDGTFECVAKEYNIK